MSNRMSFRHTIWVGHPVLAMQQTKVLQKTGCEWTEEGKKDTKQLETSPASLNNALWCWNHPTLHVNQVLSQNTSENLKKWGHRHKVTSFSVHIFSDEILETERNRFSQKLSDKALLLCTQCVPKVFWKQKMNLKLSSPMWNVRSQKGFVHSNESYVLSVCICDSCCFFWVLRIFFETWNVGCTSEAVFLLANVLFQQQWWEKQEKFQKR